MVIKVDMSEFGCGGTNFIHWAQGRPFVMTVKNNGVHRNRKCLEQMNNFLILMESLVPGDWF